MRGIPTLIIIDKNGELVDGNGRGSVMASGDKLNGFDWPTPWKQASTEQKQL